MEDYVYCRFCGKKIEKDALYCVYCGKQQLSDTHKTTKVSTVSKIVRQIHTELLSSITTILSPLKKIGQIHISKSQKNNFTRSVKRIIRIVIVITIVCALVVGAFAGYSYYNDEYLPKKYEQEAYNDLVYKFNNSDDSIKLNLAIKICKPYYSWEKEYPLVEPGRLPVLLRFNEKDTEDGYCGKAYDFIFTKAKDGNARAQFALATVLLGGKNSIWLPDTTRAVYWFNEAAKNGYVKAYGEIGSAYEKGIGVTQNLSKAVTMFKKGAELDDPKSQYKLGCMYRDGIKVGNGWHWKTTSTTEYMPREDIYREYYDEQKHTWIYESREQIMDSLVLVPQNIEIAKFWWKKAAQKGFADAEECLQQVYED